VEPETVMTSHGDLFEKRSNRERPDLETGAKDIASDANPGSGPPPEEIPFQWLCDEGKHHFPSFVCQRLVRRKAHINST
jgi:hypothetical protein